MDSIHRDNEPVSKFLVDANQSVNFCLARNPSDIHDPKKKFGPGMTHLIFGQKENIFGYSNLKLNLFYTAGKLTQYYSKTFDEKIPSDVGGVEPDNIEEKLNEQYILQQENSASSLSHFEDILRQEKKFRPYGEKLSELKRGDRTFELYKPTMMNPGFKEWYLRLETFIMWFIDGASFIDTDDEQWDYYVIFEKYKDEEGAEKHAVVGLSTVFRFYAYPEQIRPRVSQMLILPPFQGMGLAADVLKIIIDQYQVKDVTEITMEDPSPQCQRVRDFNDVRICINLKQFSSERLVKGFHLAMYSGANEAAKINRRQARRVYEILRYRCTPKFDESAMRAYRLDVKNRLNAPYKNETLRKMRLAHSSGVQLSEEDRKNLLNQEYQELIEEYEKVIKRLDRWENSQK